MTDLLIVDDHEIVRAGIKRLFENTLNLNIVADLGSGEEAYQFLQKNTVDLIWTFPCLVKAVLRQQIK